MVRRVFHVVGSNADTSASKLVTYLLSWLAHSVSPSQKSYQILFFSYICIHIYIHTYTQHHLLLNAISHNLTRARLLSPPLNLRK